MYVGVCTQSIHSHSSIDCDLALFAVSALLPQFTNNQWRTDEQIKIEKAKPGPKWKKDHEEKKAERLRPKMFEVISMEILAEFHFECYFVGDP